jgi:hypothetical protein
MLEPGPEVKSRSSVADAVIREGVAKLVMGWKRAAGGSYLA